MDSIQCEKKKFWLVAGTLRLEFLVTGGSNTHFSFAYALPVFFKNFHCTHIAVWRSTAGMLGASTIHQLMGSVHRDVLLGSKHLLGTYRTGIFLSSDLFNEIIFFQKFMLRSCRPHDCNPGFVLAVQTRITFIQQWLDIFLCIFRISQWIQRNVNIARFRIINGYHFFSSSKPSSITFHVSFGVL